MVQIEDLSKFFEAKKSGEVRAVDGISLEARPGEVLGILGVNGAGKTTLLRVLATLLVPTSGAATIAGYDLRKQARDVRQNVGFLSSTTALYNRLKAREMLLYFGSLYGLSRNTLKSRVEELIAMLEITDFANRLCDRLSTGQKQRVSLARTLLHDPPVLMLDEPTAGLDVLASRAIVDYIRHCRQIGKTILFSSHIMSEMERICDRVAVIHQGKLAALGTLDELRMQSGETALEKVFLKLIGA
jgi:sodium transport system ATP-binding protein